MVMGWKHPEQEQTFFCVFKDLCLMRADEAINFLQTSNVEKFGEKFERAGRKREE